MNVLSVPRADVRIREWLSAVLPVSRVCGCAWLRVSRAILEKHAMVPAPSIC